MRTSFNDGWRVRPWESPFSTIGRKPDQGDAVSLPHDLLIGLPRDPTAAATTAYYPRAVAYAYSKTFAVPTEWRDRSVWLEFDGVYRDAMVYLNDVFVTQRPSGYTAFVAELDDLIRFGEDNTVRVEVRAHDDSRWYSGVGILRDVALVVAPLAHLAPTSAHVSTPDVDDERAVVDVALTVRNLDIRTASTVLEVTVIDAAGAVVATDRAPVTVRGRSEEVDRRRVYIADPHRWNPDDPHLYTVRARLSSPDTTAVDELTLPLGIRTLQLDPQHGLRINGVETKLRGACVHHDNGPLGGAAIARAEHRRIELLKAAGFNAIRSAHNPISPAMLDACDRLGILVMDEAFDIWTEAKTPFDYSLDFPEWAARDIASMVLKDRNHPSVIMYSIGNEIFETGNGHGARVGRRLAEHIRTLDPSRFITNGVNALVSVIRDLEPLVAAETGGAVAGVNDAMAAMADFQSRVSASDGVSDRTEESFAVLDVVGLNYAESRYEVDRTLFPNRVIVGTETFPNRIDRNWRLVTDNAHVVGDFTWTGWDYLGEVGIGRVRYLDGDDTGFAADFPWRAAWCGDIDVTGFRRPMSYYRETVFGLRHVPYIAVHRPGDDGRPQSEGGWSWSNSIASWTWAVPRDHLMTVDVYSDAQEIELHLNGQTIGRQRVGEERAFLASFAVPYAPGELTAVALEDGLEVSRTRLSTAGRSTIVAVPDRDSITDDDGDLVHVALELIDQHGVIDTASTPRVAVEVRGGQLLALGSANPAIDEPFNGTSCTLFDGRAIAIVRPSGAGVIEVSADAQDVGSAVARVVVVPRRTVER